MTTFATRRLNGKKQTCFGAEAKDRSVPEAAEDRHELFNGPRRPRTTAAGGKKAAPLRSGQSGAYWGKRRSDGQSKVGTRSVAPQREEHPTRGRVLALTWIKTGIAIL